KRWRLSCLLLSRREPVAAPKAGFSSRVGASPTPPNAVVAQPLLAHTNRRSGSVSPSLHSNAQPSPAGRRRDGGASAAEAHADAGYHRAAKDSSRSSTWT